LPTLVFILNLSWRINRSCYQ